MRTIFDFNNIVAHKDATLLYDAEHHLLREALFRGLAEYYQPDPTGVRTTVLKPGDLTIESGGALFIEQIPISEADILPDEEHFRTDEILVALNEAPVLSLHLRSTQPSQLRQNLIDISKATAERGVADVYEYVVGVSYSELIRLGVRTAGLHPASVQCVSQYTVSRGRKSWEKYAEQYTAGKRAVSRQIPQYKLAAAFMSTVDFVELHKRLEQHR